MPVKLLSDSSHEPPPLHWVLPLLCDRLVILSIMRSKYILLYIGWGVVVVDV
jgi:hypothetical protein